MNDRDIFESKWEQIRQDSSKWWSLFSEDDLNKVEKAPVKRDKYVTLLQVKYGYTLEFARAEVARRIAPLKATPQAEKPAPAATKQAARKSRTTRARAAAR